MDPSNLSRIERGLQRPSLSALIAIGEVLGLRNLTDTIGLFLTEAVEPPEKHQQSAESAAAAWGDGPWSP